MSICRIEAHGDRLLRIGAPHAVAVNLTTELERTINRDLTVPGERAEVRIDLTQIEEREFVIATVGADRAQSFRMRDEGWLPLTPVCPRCQLVVEFVQGLIEERLTLWHRRKAYPRQDIISDRAVTTFHFGVLSDALDHNMSDA